jgi:glycosyltransferase involved in cell wall biosynthesis
LKVSIITVSKNSKDTISASIDSVLNQTYKNIEYIIIDGSSHDGTIEVIKKYIDKISYFTSEPDNGLYDAMNKGISHANGDIIGILNSDDFYIDNLVIEKVVNEFESEEVDSIYADIVFVDSKNLNKILRYYDSSFFKPKKFAYGFMPAHPAFFVKKEIYDKYGCFNTKYKIAADFDLLVRFLYIHSISYSYMKEVLVKMRPGGISNSFKSVWQINNEQLKVCKDNGIESNIVMIFFKYPVKILGYLKRFFQ